MKNRVLIITILIVSVFFVQAHFAQASTSVSSCVDFEAINSGLAGDYVLTTDLDCTGEGNAIMVGSYSGSPFTGSFDGGGYTITVDINDSSSYVGLFKYVFGATIQKLRIAGSVVGSNSTVGSLSGIANYGTVIDQVVNSANVTGTTAGGLVGLFVLNFSVTSSSISNSYNIGTVSGVNQAGGLLGTYSGVNSSTSISKSYSRGLVIGGSGSYYVGGLVGYYANPATMADSFSVSNVGGLNSNNMGAISGRITNNPATILTNNFWDITRSEQTNCIGSYSGSPYSGASGICEGVDSGSSDLNYFKNNSANTPLDTWDFTTIWETNVGGYPTLRNIIGDEGAISDDPVAPTVAPTSTASTVGAIKANLSGEITDIGGLLVTERGFEYGTTISYGSTVSQSGSYETGTFTIGTSLLTCNTFYHFRVFATNFAGTGTGSDATFTTDACPPAVTTTLYGIDGSDGNPDAPNLYIIDETTGSKLSTVGSVGFNVTGIAFHPGTNVLYGVTTYGDVTGGYPNSLISIDTTTGAGTYLGTLEDSLSTVIGMDDITFRSDGTLYGWPNNDSNLYDLYTIDIDSCDGAICLITKVGDSSLNTYGNGLAFDSIDNLFFFGDYDDSFFQIDPDTGLSLSETFFSNPSGQGYNIGAAKFDSEDTLFAGRLDYDDPPSDLITVDTSTGTITSPGDNTDMLYMEALAFKFEAISEPEPEHHHSSGSSSGAIASFVAQGVISPQNAPITKTTILSTKFNFTSNLKQNSVGNDVRNLQIFLNNHGFVVSNTDGGSPGFETNYFGPKTKAALIKFQQANHINPAIGYFGSITRAFISRLSI